ERGVGRVLPDGWEVEQDEEGREYFVHVLTGASQWEHPATPTPALTTPRDKTHQEATGGATDEEEEEAADQTVELPHGWETAIDEAGNLYYFNSETGQSQWEPPGPAEYHLEQQKRSPFRGAGDEEGVSVPPGWEAIVSDVNDISGGGSVYYHEISTGRTQWERPMNT
ncbi:unnamed protein product, partial [Discosporangium mesarthrocarpum]